MEYLKNRVCIITILVIQSFCVYGQEDSVILSNVILESLVLFDGDSSSMNVWFENGKESGFGQISHENEIYYIPFFQGVKDGVGLAFRENSLDKILFYRNDSINFVLRLWNNKSLRDLNEFMNDRNGNKLIEFEKKFVYLYLRKNGEIREELRLKKDGTLLKRIFFPSKGERKTLLFE